MKKLIFLVASVIVVAGCRADFSPGETVEQGTNPLGTSQIKYVHDDKHGVGCWFFVDESGSSLSCLPDSQYTP